MAQHIARRYAYRGEDSDDLEQVATLGLILAVDRFDPDRNVDFLSYAAPTITGEVLRYFRDRSATIRVPRRLRKLRASSLEWRQSWASATVGPPGPARSRLR